MADFGDFEDLLSWLKKLSREDCITVSTRAVLRILPATWLQFDGGKGRSPSENELILLFRAAALGFTLAKYESSFRSLENVYRDTSVRLTSQ